VDCATLTVVMDGAESVVPVHPGQSLLDAAEDSGLELPAICRQGNCGACAVSLTSGSVRMPDCKGISKRDRAAGLILACQATPSSEKLTINYDE
jgi:ferredoxin